MFAAKADLANEPGVDQVCQDTQGHKHRFDITLPNAMLADFHGRGIVVHGIRVAGTAGNAAIAGSGTIQFLMLLRCALSPLRFRISQGFTHAARNTPAYSSPTAN